MTEDGTEPNGVLQLDDELLHQLFAAAPTAMIVVAASGEVCLANRAAEDLFGVGRGGLLRQSVEELVPLRLREQHAAQRAAFFAAPATRAMGSGRDLFGLRRDGAEVPIEIGLNPVRTQTGLFVLAAIVDLTSRKQFEESLRQSENRLRAVVESAPNAMVMIARDGRMVLVNTEAELLFGWSRDEMLGRPVEMLVPVRFRERHPELRTSFFDLPTTRAMGAGRDLFGLHRDGTEVPIEIGLNPIDTPEGLCVLASIIDITQRKAAEALVRRSLTEKETLLREVHHRVKNNLQVISSMLSLQQSYVAEPNLQRALEACRGRVKSMALVHEKLYLGGNLATIDFADYVRELSLMLVDSLANLRGVRLEFRTSPVTFNIDTAIPVGLILNELVTNAIKHAFVGRTGGRIEVGLEPLHADRAVLWVADDGVGLPENFDASANTTLGMRVVRSLVRQIDGKLAIAKRPCSFRLEFAVARSAQETAS